MAGPFLVAVAVAVVVLSVVEVVEHRAMRRRPPRPRLRVVEPPRPADDVVPGLDDRVRRFLLDAARRADAGEPLPPAVRELMTRRASGGAR